MALFAGVERPSVADILASLRAYCRKERLRCPSRATIYNAMRRVVPPAYSLDELPEEVRRCLHNVDGARVPGHQVVFAAFNHGDVRALSFASGMPWACLYRAVSVPGSRPKSRALLQAVLEYRGIGHAA